jgi:hypothetical protein
MLSIIWLAILAIYLGSNTAGNVASALETPRSEEFLQKLQQYYQKIPMGTTKMPDTPAAMRQWYAGYKSIERDIQQLASRYPKLSKAETLKASLIINRITASKAGFSPAKSAVGVVENLSRNINLFKNCNDDLGIGYCKFNDMDAVRTIETSGKPLGYYFAPDEIEAATKLIRLIKKYNGIRQ